MKTQNMTYDDGTHYWGRIWLWGMGVVLLLLPAAICLYFDAWPEANGLFKGLIAVAPTFWAVGTIEVLTYVPMLGAGGSYLGFITGNLTNLKVPCTITALNKVGAKPGTPEGEVVGTIAVATSSIVTTLIIFVGVLLIVPLAPILNSPSLKPAFEQILPALFGGLGVALIGQNLKVAIVPVVSMIVLFVCAPSFANSVGLVFVPVAAAIAIAAARIMYKIGWLK
ncbi:MAG: hypothetical protein CVU91_12840 [Firmicutes bacterium HGW-Firmicutes-16]|nr:MAG: hypothetical protein CVU91_12840 [Firmicutes bacterium HGW-Firmicutes-16]